MSTEFMSSAGSSGGGGMGGWIGLGAQALGGIMQSQGASNSSAGAAEAYNYQAQVAQNNAEYADWKARDAIARGQVDTARRMLQTNQLKGKQRASFAARGIDMGEGSALNILTDTDYLGAIDAGQITDNASRESQGYEREGQNYSDNAELLRRRANQQEDSHAGLSSLLSTAGSVASSWYSMKSKGAIK